LKVSRISPSSQCGRHQKASLPPVLKYNRQLMQAILWDRLPIVKIVNVKVIDLEQAPEGDKSLDAGVASEFKSIRTAQLARAA
jgi:glutathione-independent formaldehyde dehydrogenase